MKALGQFVLIEREREPVKTITGILLPDSAKQANAYPKGKVISIGGKVTIPLKVGDTIMFQLHRATSIKGMIYHTHQENILMKYEGK